MIDYTPRKVSDFQQIFIDEAKCLIEIFRNDIVEIHHFGSTSVDGLAVRETLDMMPVVKDLDKVDHYMSDMERLGYTYVPTHSTEAHRIFTRTFNDVTRKIVMVERTDFQAIDRRIAVRDYLRDNSDARQNYSDYKTKLAMRYQDDGLYTEHKNKYLKQLETEAIKWYQSK